MLTSQRSKSQLFRVVCTAAILAFVFVSCSSDDIPGVQSSNYYGMASDPSNVPVQISLQGLSAATQAVTLGSSSGVALSGTIIRAGSAPIDVTGFYDTGSGSIAFEDDAGTWSFFGTAAGTTASGASTTPFGAGSFILFIGATPTSVTIYCGTGSCTAGCKGSVGISLVVGGTTAIMTANLSGLPSVAGGTVTGTAVHFDVSLPGGETADIDGTISGGAITGGTWSASTGDAGDWSASTAECTSAPTLRH